MGVCVCVYDLSPVDPTASSTVLHQEVVLPDHKRKKITAEAGTDMMAVEPTKPSR